MKLNEVKFKWLVENVDPSPIYQAITSDALLQQQAAETKATTPEGDYAAMLGLAPGQPQQPGMAALPPGAMQQLGAQMTQPSAPAKPAPAIAPPKPPGKINLPPVSIPRGLGGVPQLKDILGGTRGGSF